MSPRPTGIDEEMRTLSAVPARRGVLRTAARYARPHASTLSAAVVLGVLASLATTLGPVVVGRVTDSLLASDRSSVFLLGAIGIVLALLQLILQAVARSRLSAAGELLIRDVRDDVAHRLASAPLRFVTAHRRGELLQRATAEIAELSAFVRDSLTAILVTGATVILFVIVLAAESWVLLLVLLCTFLPPSLFVMHRFRRRAATVYGTQAQTEAHVAAEIAETVRIRRLVRDAPERTRARLTEQFDTTNGQAVDAQLRTAVLGRWINAMTLIEGTGLVALVIAGSVLVGADIVTPGVVVTFVIASITLFASFSQLVELIGSIEEAATGAARVRELILCASDAPRAALPSDLADTHDAHRADAAPAGIAVELDGVWFGYTDEPVVRGVSLRIPHGERSGLAGRTGSGKSTIAALIAGLHRPDRGTVRCHGVDPSSLSPSARARLISYVPQAVTLGGPTVRAELGLASPDADDETLHRAASALGLASWLTSLPDGLDTPVDDESAISAGERQIIGILRVALRRSEIVVLDEVTADIDPATAQFIEQALDRLSADRTVIVVAHRPATLDRLDTVHELADGNLRRRDASQ